MKLATYGETVLPSAEVEAEAFSASKPSLEGRRRRVSSVTRKGTRRPPVQSAKRGWYQSGRRLLLPQRELLRRTVLRLFPDQRRIHVSARLQCRAAYRECTWMFVWTARLMPIRGCEDVELSTRDPCVHCYLAHLLLSMALVSMHLPPAGWQLSMAILLM